MYGIRVQRTRNSVTDWEFLISVTTGVAMWPLRSQAVLYAKSIYDGTAVMYDVVEITDPQIYFGVEPRSTVEEDFRDLEEVRFRLEETRCTHRKTDGEYEITDFGLDEESLEKVVVYRSTLVDTVPHVWVRPLKSFMDGRFKLHG